jgi:capsular polysaccharide export protein
MNEPRWAAFAGQRVLLLQGPMGPFFRRLQSALYSAGAADVLCVNFNGGDWLFAGRGAINYRGTMADWPRTLVELVRQHRSDVVMLFGDCRLIHRPAIDLAQRGKVQTWVFEEGYVRPNYVTFERSGVNNHSLLPRTPGFYRALPEQHIVAEQRMGNTFWWAATFAFIYYVAAIGLRPWFQHYHHHRLLSVSEMIPWLKSPVRKWARKWLERGIQARLTGELHKRYFLVPLQVATDAQVLVHSKFDSLAEYIRSVAASFARHADAADHLVIKHHPMDRGVHNYQALIRELGSQHRLAGRLHYIHDQHLPTLLEHARGVVVVNSTVGLSALHHGTPLKVLGQALYDIPGLTAQAPLDQFWREAEASAPDQNLYRRFRAYLVRTTQLNGSFYRREPLTPVFVAPSASHAVASAPKTASAG